MSEEEGKREITKIVIFITKEGIKVELERKYAEYSLLVKGMLDEIESDPIPLPEITKFTFDKVIIYIKHILDEGNLPPELPKPLPSNDLGDVTSPFYATFIEGTDEEIQDIILAANYLDIKCLLALGCAKMGSIIRGMSIPEFRKRFNIVNDFTPEEEAEAFDDAKIAELAEAHEKEQK